MRSAYLLIAAVLALSSLYGCLETNKDFTCCLRHYANDTGKCKMYNSTDPNNPLDLSAKTNWCNMTANVCNVTTKDQKVTGFWPNIVLSPAEHSLIPICTELGPQQCIDPKCRVMVCGDFEFRPKVPPTVEDSQKAASKQSGSSAINLYHGQCQFLPMDYKLAGIMKNSQGYLSRFRIGLGTTFDEYAKYSAFFPISDKFCNINTLGTIDRFQNYLVPAQMKFDPLTGINDSCVSDQDPAQAPPPLKLGNLNLGPTNQPVTGYKMAGFIREVSFPVSDINTNYFMTPYSRPDPKFYATELQKRYLDDAYNYTMWVIHVNDKLKDAKIPKASLSTDCSKCAGLCDQVPACMDATIYGERCKTDWANYDKYLEEKAAAEAEVTKALGERPKAAPKALYECDPNRPSECLSSRCSTDDYNRVNLFVSGQEVALPCTLSTVQAPNYDKMFEPNLSAVLPQDGKTVYDSDLGSLMAPYDTYDVLRCEPTTDITFDTPGSSVATHHLAQASYKAAGSDQYTEGTAGDIVLFSYDKARYPADHIYLKYKTDITNTPQDTICSSGESCAGKYEADYSNTGKPVIGYTVMNGQDFPNTLFARLCQLNSSTDYEVVKINNDTVCGEDTHAPLGSCMVAWETPGGSVGNSQKNCYHTMGCVAQGGGSDAVAFFFATGCAIQGQGSCNNPEISPNLADSYYGLSRTFGSGALYNGISTSWQDFPAEIRPQFLNDLQAMHARPDDKNDFQSNRYMCLSPEYPGQQTQADSSPDCVADIPNAPKEIVLIHSLGACDYDLKPGTFPKLKEYGWCDSCTLASMAYQKVDRLDIPYIPLNEVGYSSTTGNPKNYTYQFQKGPAVFDASQLADSFNSSPICTWQPVDDNNKLAFMRCNTSTDFKPYHKQDPGNIHAPQEEPEATYLKMQMARFQQSGAIPILDLSDDADWAPIDATIYVDESGFYDKCKSDNQESASSFCSLGALQLQYKPACENDYPGDMAKVLQCMNDRCIEDQLKNACASVPDTQTVAKQVQEYMSTRLIYNQGATIVVVEGTNASEDAAVMQENIKTRNQIIKKDCPRCLTAVRVMGYDNATFAASLSRVFNGTNCFGIIGGIGAGTCNMLLADDPLFGVDVVIFDYGVQENKEAYKSSKTPDEKATAVIGDLQDRGFYILKNYNKPSIVFDFYVSQQDLAGSTSNPDGWSKDEVDALFKKMIEREDDLVKAGVTGLFYARVKSVPYPEAGKSTDTDWTKLITPSDDSVHRSMCSLSQAMLRMVAEKPLTLIERKSATPVVYCTDCSYSDLYSGTCSMTCGNGINCTAGPDATALSDLKCPDGGIPDPCRECNTTGKTFTCTIEYENGSIVKHDVDSKDISNDAYADVISGIAAPDKCCLSNEGANYSFTQSSVTIGVNSPVVFSKSGDTNVDCAFPSASSLQNAGQGQFCNVKTNTMNYRVSCIEKNAYDKLSAIGAFKGGFDFSKNYQAINTAQVPGTGGALKASPGGLVNGGNAVISSSGAVQGVNDPCLNENPSGTGGGLVQAQPGVITGTGGAAQTCEGPAYICSEFAKQWEKAKEKQCTDYIAQCRAEPWTYSSYPDYEFCPGQDDCKNNFNTYCAKVIQKYGNGQLACEDACCENMCQITICPPDPNNPKQSAPGCTEVTCPPDPCLQRNDSCELTCNKAGGGSAIVDPPYPWAPGGSLAGKGNDPCKAFQQTGPTVK